MLLSCPRSYMYNFVYVTNTDLYSFGNISLRKNLDDTDRELCLDKSVAMLCHYHKSLVAD